MTKRDKKNKRPFQLSEKQLGYTMIAPSIILILLVVIWPIMLSGWNSLFDYRLNDPTRSERIMSESLNMETYADNRYLIEQSVTELSDLEPEAADDLEAAEATMDEYHEALMEDEAIQEQYNEVNNRLENFEPISSGLLIASLDGDWGSEFNQALSTHIDTIRSYQENLGEEEAVEFGYMASQLEGLQGSVLDSNFVGVDNYAQYLTNARTWTAMGNTVVFTVVSVGFELILGLSVAILINRAFKGRGLVRTAVLVPWAIPTAVAAMMWSYLYDGQSGIVAHYMAQLGIISDPGVLLTTAGGSMFSIILADVWKTTPYMALLLLAGLQTIPRSLYEAAEVDGANRWQQFVSVTLPLLKPAILVALLFRTLDAFRVFDLIYVLTGGGPANATESISVYAYKALFEQQNFGAGSALSVIVFVSVAIISVIFVKMIGSDLFAERTKR